MGMPDSLVMRSISSNDVTEVLSPPSVSTTMARRFFSPFISRMALKMAS